MNQQVLLHLIKRYGHWCAEAAIADERDRSKRYKLATETSIGILEQIMAIVKKMPLCTGVAAGWCPIHGDCTCVEGSDNYHNDENCPLHSATSNHAEGVTD